MDYPIEILPDPAYKIIDCDLSDYFLIRLTFTDKIEEIISESGEINIRQVCSPEELIDDLSFSLYGIYNLSHINLNFTKAGKDRLMHYCRPDEEVEIPVFGTEFTNDAVRHRWFARIGDLHNVPFNYTRSNDPFVAICIVRHTPMKWNFWHFSLRWETDLGPLEELEERKRKNVAKRIGHSVRAEIARLAKLDVPETPALEKRCYCKN
jgi:hypothetical protein